MAHITPVEAEFCSFCGTLLPIPEERPLSGKSALGHPIYDCPNCGASTETPPLIGYFSPDTLERLRSLS